MTLSFVRIWAGNRANGSNEIDIGRLYLRCEITTTASNG
jgi:hypothetical protein